jgi:hypothetical protein
MDRLFRMGRRGLEFEAFVKHAGLTPARAIQSGTTINARVMGWREQVGSIDKASTQCELQKIVLAHSSLLHGSGRLNGTRAVEECPFTKTGQITFSDS